VSSNVRWLLRNPRLETIFILVSAGLAFSDVVASTIICKYSRLDDLSWVKVQLENADVVLLGTVISAEFPAKSQMDITLCQLVGQPRS
jgi:hypothetical protein